MPPAGGNSSYGMQRRLGAAKVHEFSLVSNYKNGYRNREDVTNLPPGVLIVGSQNVFTNVSERVQIRKGYLLDGPSSVVVAPITASFDWDTRYNTEVHQRAGFLTSTGNDGKMQYRYVDANGTVTWRDLETSLTSTSFNFTTYWDSTESLREVLYVNGSPEIHQWNGAVTTISASTSTSITKTGDTWANSGFYVTTSPRAIVAGTTTFTYTGGESTLTLTGVTPNASTIAAGAVTHQAVIIASISTFTSGPPAGFKVGLISTLNNQVFLGSLTQSAVWISVVNNYKSYAASTPRQTGEGSTLILDQNTVAFNPQENFMYVSCGKDQWYNVNFEMQTSTVGVTYEQVNALRLKTGKRQGAISQAFVAHMKNNIIVATNETTIDTLGRIETSLATPQTVNLSDSIKLDVDSYDFTDGSVFYFKYNIYVAVPKEGIVIVYNIATGSWESPQILPISRFYIVDGELYGHSYNTSESYQLFTGYADRAYPGFLGFPIQANMVFSYQNFGTRSTLKKANALYVEGYINQNTTLDAVITYELDGCATSKSFTIDGSDSQIVCLPPIQGSLGKVSLGKVKLGGMGGQSIQGLPPKFRVEKTFSNTDFFESSVSFSILGTNQRFEIIAFGLNASASSNEPVFIRE